MHSGVAIDFLALEASAGSRQIKRHSEERSGEERPVPGCDESEQLHSAVGREQELGPGQRTRVRHGLWGGQTHRHTDVGLEDGVVAG